MEAVRRAFAAFNRRDLEALLEEFDPEIEWHTATDLPDSRVYRGHDGVVALIQEWDNLFGGLHGDVEEFIDRGNYVVVPVVFRGRILGSLESDPEIPLRRVNVYTLREGKLVECREYLTRERALKAAGLRE